MLIPVWVLCHGVESNAVKPKQILIICGCSSTSTFKTCLALGLLCVQIYKSCRSYWFQILKQTLPSKSTIFPQKPFDSWHLPRCLAMFWSPAFPIPSHPLRSPHHHSPSRSALLVTKAFCESSSPQCGSCGRCGSAKLPWSATRSTPSSAAKAFWVNSKGWCQSHRSSLQVFNFPWLSSGPSGVKRSRNTHQRNWMIFQL